MRSTCYYYSNTHDCKCGGKKRQKCDGKLVDILQFPLTASDPT